MIDFMLEKIFLPLLLILLFAAIISIPVLFVQHSKYEAYLKDCFKQENRTKECEYALWEYENRPNTQPAIIATPVVFR